jgi:hypothetical protein
MESPRRSRDMWFASSPATPHSTTLRTRAGDPAIRCVRSQLAAFPSSLPRALIPTETERERQTDRDERETPWRGCGARSCSLIPGLRAESTS